MKLTNKGGGVMSYLETMLNDVNVGVIAPKQQLFVQVPIEFICNYEYTDKELRLYLYLWSFSVIGPASAYPSHAKIQKDLKWSRSTVIRTLNSLEDKKGIFTINRFYEETKEKTSNLYFLIAIKNGRFDICEYNKLEKMYPNRIFKMKKNGTRLETLENRSKRLF